MEVWELKLSPYPSAEIILVGVHGHNMEFVGRENGMYTNLSNASSRPRAILVQDVERTLQWRERTARAQGTTVRGYRYCLWSYHVLS